MCSTFSILNILFKLSLFETQEQCCETSSANATQNKDVWYNTLCFPLIFFPLSQHKTLLQLKVVNGIYEEQPTLLHFYWTHKWENTVSDTTARYYLGVERSYFPPMQRRPRLYSIIMQFFWEEEILHLHCHLRNTTTFCMVIIHPKSNTDHEKNRNISHWVTTGGEVFIFGHAIHTTSETVLFSDSGGHQWFQQHHCITWPELFEGFCHLIMW